MGRIAAGTPIEALQTSQPPITLPTDFLSHGEHYALEVAAIPWSMPESRWRSCGDPPAARRYTGDIIVALIDEEEATSNVSAAAVFHRAGTGERGLRIRVLGPDRVQIQGKLIGIYRQKY